MPQDLIVLFNSYFQLSESVFTTLFSIPPATETQISIGMDPILFDKQNHIFLVESKL